jgi:hypothetical protein
MSDDNLGQFWDPEELARIKTQRQQQREFDKPIQPVNGEVWDKPGGEALGKILEFDADEE